MKQGNVLVRASIDDTAKKWFTLEKYGQFAIGVLTLIAYVLCTLWILGYIP